MEIGVIGAGSIANKHLENVDAGTDAEVVAICDIDAETAERVAETYGARAYTDSTGFYEEEDIDAVIISIPPFAHDRHEIEAAERGIPFFVEKPVALDVDRATEISARVEEAGVVNQVGYVLRYGELTQRINDLISDAEIGSAVGTYSYPGPPDSDWWQRRELSGGQVTEQSTHLFDFLRFLFGEVDRVAAMGDRDFYDSIDFPETTGSVLQHDDGTVSQVLSSLAAPEQVFELRIYGPETDLRINFMERKISGIVGGDPLTFESTENPFLTQILGFLDAAERGDPEAVTGCTYADAIKTLELTLAVDESVDTGAVIDL